MAGLTAQHWLTPDWDPHLTIAQLSLPHLTAHGLKAAVIDVDRTLLPGRDVTLPGPVRDWLVDAGRRLQLHLFSNCLLYTSPSPRDRTRSRMPSSA